jgi:hypothetical protein
MTWPVVRCGSWLQQGASRFTFTMPFTKAPVLFVGIFSMMGRSLMEEKRDTLFPEQTLAGSSSKKIPRISAISATIELNTSVPGDQTPKKLSKYLNRS